jgi:thiamine pyrophosphate-dependent acetolactate synthase large subunit-like protein
MKTDRSAGEERMSVECALQTLVDLRPADQIVITNQSSARLWPRLSDHALDFNYNPSNMGGAVPFAVGLALAQPNREVVVLSGDGSLLMSLGCLVTAINSRVENLSIALLDNQMYEVTGGQKTPATESDIDFAGLARAAGFPNVSHFWSLDDWQNRSGNLFAAGGPRFVWLEVGPTPQEVFDDTLLPIPQRLERLRQSLHV